MEPKINAARPGRDYLPTLDGWRALSIAAVILCHDKLHYFGPFSTEWFYQHGNLGVDIFFAISGLLICSRLLEEERTTGTISIHTFYTRRAFRILPPATAYLGMLIFLAKAIGLPVGIPEILASIFFVRNYTFTFLPFQKMEAAYTGHFWSLAVEEHFYLILPALLVFAPKKWRVPTLFLLAVTVGVHRFFIGPNASGMHTDTRLDALLVPAAFAILLQSAPFRSRLIPWLRLWPLLAVIIVTVVIAAHTPRLQPILLAWTMPFLVLGTMLRPQSLFSRFLELPLMRYCGRLSYSVYLWHVLFFVDHFGAPFPGWDILQRWPLCLIMTIGCSMLSYHLIERPAIRFGHRLAAIPSVRKNNGQPEAQLQ